VPSAAYVIAPSPTLQAAGVNRWLLVDGQQRLTTLMLALAAIRDHVSSSGEGDVDRIHRQSRGCSSPGSSPGGPAWRCSGRPRESDRALTRSPAGRRCDSAGRSGLAGRRPLTCQISLH
jgi:hypothetical protein